MATPHDQMNNQTDASGIVWEPAMVRGINVFVGKKDGQIVDVLGELTDAQYQELVSHADNRNRDFRTSCFTYIFQSELAAFEKLCLSKPELAKDGVGALAKDLRTWSSYYAKFEKMLNNSQSLADPMGEVVNALETFIQEINTSAMPKSMQKKLLEDAKKFLDQAKQLQGKPPTPQEIREFFSIQPEKTSAPCIGQFLANQLWNMSAEARAEVRRLEDKRIGVVGNMFKRAFNPHPLYNHLSDAKAYIERKGLSLHGVAANNSRDPVDVGMVDSLTQNEKASTQNPSYVSIIDYVDVGGDPAETERLFAHLNKASRNLDDKAPTTGGALAATGMFFANLGELVSTVVVRGGLTAVTGLAYMFARIPGVVFGKPWNDAVDNIFDRIERGITSAHHWLSSKIGVARFKEARYADYTEGMKKIHSPQSGYASMAHVLNGKAVGGFIANGVGSILAALVANPLAAARMFITNEGKYRDDVLDKRFKPNTYRERKIEAFKKQAVKNYDSAMKEKTVDKSSAQEEKGNLPADIKMRRGVRPWARNEYSSPLEFFDEIVTGLADAILSPMFRHNPGFAAIFFVFAHASFGVMAAPGFVPGVYGSNHALMMISKLVAKDFMGKTVGQAPGASLTSDVFTAFLNFKLPLIFTEGIKEMTFGEYSQYILAHPEKITMGALVFSAFMGATYCLSFFPQLHLPEALPESMLSVNVPTPMGSMPTVSVGIPPAEILNVFVEEAAEVQAHGLWPLTSIEFGFLALKLVLLTKGMLAKSHDPAEEAQREEACTLFADSKIRKKFTKAMMKNLVEFNAKLTQGEPKRGIKDFTPHEAMELLIKPALKEVGVPDGNVQNSMAEQIQKDLSWACDETQKANDASKQTADAFSEIIAKDKKREEMRDPSNRLLPAGTMPPTKRQQLMDLIRYVQMFEMTHEGEKMDLDTANALYDSLYYAFKAYNDEQRKLGHWDRMIDKNSFLHAFNNRYIEPHEKSNALVSALRAPVAWITGNRMKRPSDAPHRRNRIKQRAATEKSWLMEPIAMGFRAGLNYGRGWSLVGTAALLPVAVPAAILWTAGCAVLGGLQAGFNRVFSRKNKASETWTKWKGRMHSGMEAIENTITFDAEKIDSPDWMKASYAKNTRIAGTSSEHLDPEGKHILQQLETHEQEERDIPTVLNENADVEDHKSFWLDGYERKHAEKTMFSSKSKRRDEKTMLTRYATAMSDLSKRIMQLQARLNRINPSSTNGEFNIIKGTLDEYDRQMKEFEKDNLTQDNPEKKINARLNFYSGAIATLMQLEKTIKAAEDKKVAELTGANKPHVSATNGSGATQATNSAVIKNDSHVNGSEQEKMANAVTVTHMIHHDVAPADIQKMIDGERVVAFLPVKGSNVKDTTEVIDLAGVYGANNQDLINNFNGNDIQLNLDDNATTLIKAVPSADGTEMNLMICNEVGDEQNKWVPITETHLNNYAKLNPDAPSLGKGAMIELTRKMNDKNTNQITVATVTSKDQQQQTVQSQASQPPH